MNHTRRIRRFCAAMLLTVTLPRLWAAGMPEKLLSWLMQPDRNESLTYAETGRIVRFSSSEGVVSAFFRESAPPVLPETKPGFSPEDLDFLEITYLTNLRPDLETLLTQPLDWDLGSDDPAVLILHTHSTESYTPSGENYTESAAWRTLDENYNMLSIGKYLAELLQSEGIGVIQDRTVHDYPSYSGSYNHARKSVQEILRENPTIRLILDLHRDAAGTEKNPLRPAVSLSGGTGARLMLVMGTDASGLKHENWEENLSLALKLHVQLERQAPGIMRPLCLRSQRFNQDLNPGMLLVEVGATGNTRAEALLAAQQLAFAIAAMAKGSAS